MAAPHDDAPDGVPPVSEDPLGPDCVEKLRRVVPLVVSMNASLQRTVDDSAHRYSALEAKSRAQEAVLSSLGIALPEGHETPEVFQHHAREAALQVAALRQSASAAAARTAPTDPTTAPSPPLPEQRNDAPSSAAPAAPAAGLPQDLAPVIGALSAVIEGFADDADRKLSQHLALAVASARLATGALPAGSVSGPLARLGHRVEGMERAAEQAGAPHLKRSISRLAEFSGAKRHRSEQALVD